MWALMSLTQEGGRLISGFVISRRYPAQNIYTSSSYEFVISHLHLLDKHLLKTGRKGMARPPVQP